MTTDLSSTADLQRLPDIEQRLEQLLQDRRSILAELEPRALPTVDPVAYQTAATHRRVIAQLADALDRLRAGTCGTCVRCGESIAPARLDAIPHAAACIRCQNHAEAA